MIQMVDGPKTTPILVKIGKVTFIDFVFRCSCSHASLSGTVLRGVQYVALGPRIKVVISIILPASTRNKLKFSLKMAFMFLAIILKWQVPNGDIFLVIRKKGDCARRPLVRECGPWSATHVNSTKSKRKSSRE